MSSREDTVSRVLQRIDHHPPGSELAKHVKMARSPFVFLRGSSALFYDDLKTGVIKLPEVLNTWPNCFVIGDCHVSNFGLFSEEGSHGEKIIFAPNDFDDCSFGRAPWDLLRFLVSVILCADHCQGAKQGLYHIEDLEIEENIISEDQVSEALEKFIEEYSETCQQLINNKIDYDEVIDKVDKDHFLHKSFKKAKDRACGGEDFSEKSSLAKAVDLSAELLTFKNIEDKFETLDENLYCEIEEQFAPYVDDNILDIVARHGAGTGSVNMNRYYLLVGPQKENNSKLWPLYHIVEIKKQRAGAPIFEFSDISPVNRLNPAHLTVVSQRRMQRDPDLVLDEVKWSNEHWLVRSRHHSKIGFDPEDLCFGKRATKNGYIEYAKACAKTLALAHARGDRRSKAFEQAVASSLENESQELINIARNYSEQVKQDWQWLKFKELGQ